MRRLTAGQTPYHVVRRVVQRFGRVPATLPERQDGAQRRIRSDADSLVPCSRSVAIEPVGACRGIAASTGGQRTLRRSAADLPAAPPAPPRGGPSATTVGPIEFQDLSGAKFRAGRAVERRPRHPPSTPGGLGGSTIAPPRPSSHRMTVPIVVPLRAMARHSARRPAPSRRWDVVSRRARDAVAAGALGAVHGGVRTVDEVLDVVAGRDLGHTDARGDPRGGADRARRPPAAARRASRRRRSPRCRPGRRTRRRPAGPRCRSRGRRRRGRYATALSIASPAACPPASLTALKPSRSTRQTTVGGPRPRRPRRAASRSRKARRFGMPVSASVAASISCVRISSDLAVVGGPRVGRRHRTDHREDHHDHEEEQARRVSSGQLDEEHVARVMSVPMATTP